MSNTPLKIAEKQVESAVKNRLRQEQQGILRHASITRVVSGKLEAASRKSEKKQKTKFGRSGVYVQDAQGSVAPDGYVRRSPVQELRVAPGYTKKLVLKCIAIAVLLLLAVGAAALLVKYVAI